MKSVNIKRQTLNAPTYSIGIPTFEYGTTCGCRYECAVEHHLEVKCDRVCIWMHAQLACHVDPSPIDTSHWRYLKLEGLHFTGSQTVV